MLASAIVTVLSSVPEGRTAGDATTVWDILTAAGTVVAALTAVGTVIYIEEFKPRRRRPSLSVILERGRPEYEATVCPDGNCCEHWLRLRVVAARGRDAAEDAEVLFVARRAATTGQPRPVEPRNLRWSATTRTFDRGKLLDLLADDAPEPKTRMRLPGGTYRYVDVVQASDGDAVEEEQRRVPRVCTWPFHADRHTLDRGACTLYFALVANGTDATYFSLDVDWDGVWAADATWWDHLVVRGPTELEELPADL